MAAPIFSYVTNVSTNIAICTILAPLPFSSSGSAGALPQNIQLQSEVIDLAIFSLVAGSTGVGTVLTLQELGLDSSLSAGALVPVWRTVTTGGGTSTPVTITLANSTPYGAVINGPFHGLRFLISGVVGNGVAYARISGTVRMV